MNDHSPVTDAGSARIELTMNGGHLLSITLAELALLNRAGLGTLTFTYRDPIDPEEPDAPRPLRTATLRITDDHEWPEPQTEYQCRFMETRNCRGPATCAEVCTRFERPFATD